MLPRTAFFLASFVASFLSADGQFVIPEVQIQANTPFGFRASIPALPGIKLFGFHAKVNSNLEGKETGQFDGDVTEATGIRFIFEDRNARISEGDTVHYWVFVQHENLGYRKDDQVYHVTKLVPIGTPFNDTLSQVVTVTKKPPSCDPSPTTINNGKPACKGHLIFEELFINKDNLTKWRIENSMPTDEQENNFVSYQPKSISFVGNALVITPKLLQDLPGYTEESIISGELDLNLGCTAAQPSQCYLDASQGNGILPPIVSGKISTKNQFSFKYGKVEIRAKLPQGNWIYPELLLEPLNSFYGMEGYSSGVIRIAFARGNLELNAGGVLYDNSVLSGGVVLSQFEPCRSTQGIKENSIKNVPWGNDYHVYGLTWKEDLIQLSVDNKVYGTIVPVAGGFKKFNSNCREVAKFDLWKQGGPFAPFDKEFYISLGLGVGGVSDFPDSVGAKPWGNKKSNSRLEFWNNISSVNSTWNANSRLSVDHVKVWAI